MAFYTLRTQAIRICPTPIRFMDGFLDITPKIFNCFRVMRIAPRQTALRRSLDRSPGEAASGWAAADWQWMEVVIYTSPLATGISTPSPIQLGQNMETAS